MTNLVKRIRLGIVSALATGILVAIIGLFGSGGPPPVSAQADTTAPTISSVAITSSAEDANTYSFSPGSDDTYAIDDSIEVTVTFNEDVTVTGTPRLELDFGGTRKAAGYDSASGSTVVFSYTVAEGDSDSNGIAISANKLTLNGGAIKDAADNDADLSHDALSAQTSHKVDGVRPRVSGTSNSPSGFSISSGTDNVDGVCTIGDRIFIGLSWSESMSGGGEIQLTLDLNGTSRTGDWTAGWIGTFAEYVVQEGDLAPGGVAIPANAISLNGGYMRDIAGNDAVLTHSAAAAASLSSEIYPVDGVRPTITSIEIDSDPGDDDTYGVGDRIRVLVTFSENIQAFGAGVMHNGVSSYMTPTIELNIGGEARIADYTSHSGTTVTFDYTVQSDDTDDNGISIGANKVSIDTPVSDTYLILDNPNAPFRGNGADVTHEAIADDSDHKVDGASSTLSISGESLVFFTENGEEKVGYYNPSGADGEVTWSLSGDDSDDFSITRAGTLQGQLWFQPSPNYEDPTDSDADNEYSVTLNVSDGTNTSSLQVAVLVTNVLFDADEVPVLVGEARVGETLTVDMSNITYSPDMGLMRYLWERIDGDTETRVAATTDSSYTLTADDVDKTIRLTVVVLAYQNHYLVGEPTATVAAANNAATGAPTISGTAQVGETLTADTSGISDIDGLDNATYSYQWLTSRDAEISGATNDSYTLVSADEDKTIKVRVSFTDDAGYEESLTSAVTDAVVLGGL